MKKHGRPLGSHIMCRLADRRVIAPSVADRRIVARVVYERTRGEPLLAHGIPDTHHHSLIGPGCSVPPEELGRRIQISLNQRLRLGVSFEKAKVKPIADQHHLRSCFDYVLTQNEQHGLDWDPLHEASSVHDLLGLRLAGQWTVSHVRAYLPRVKRADVLGFIGLTDLQPIEACDWLVRNAALLPDVAAAALARSDLCGRGRDVRAAQRAVIELARTLGMRFNEIAALLGVRPRTVRRLRTLELDQRMWMAVRLQLALRKATGA